MLYDPKWSKAPSLDGFIAWLETKDPNERYDYWNCLTCACGQYASSFSIANPDWIWEWKDRHLTTELNMIGRGSGNYEEWTFGAALARALAYRASL
jgi:hypothetical protein